MKISKNELRKMIFETVLREQEVRSRKRRKSKVKQASPPSAPENKTPLDALIDLQRKYLAEKNENEKKSIVKAMAAMINASPESKQKYFTSDTSYQAFLEKVPELKALLEPADNKGPREEKKSKTKPPNPRIKQVQRLLNSFLGDKNEQLEVNGYWNSSKMDPVMEKVMNKLKVKNPDQSWKDMAPGLKAAPTLQGLIEYLNSKKNSKDGTSNQNLGTSDPEDDRADIESKTEESSKEASEKAAPASPTIKTSQEVKDKVILRMAAYEIELLDSQYRPLYFGDEEGNISDKLINYVKNKTPEEGKDKNNEELAIMILSNASGYTPKALSSFKNNPADILSKMNTDKKGFDLPGQDSQYPKGFKKNLLGALARAFGMSPDNYSGIPLNESKVVYGKSHATLLRERYWGRY